MKPCQYFFFNKNKYKLEKTDYNIKKLNIMIICFMRIFVFFFTNKNLKVFIQK